MERKKSVVLLSAMMLLCLPLSILAADLGNSESEQSQDRIESLETGLTVEPETGWTMKGEGFVIDSEDEGITNEPDKTENTFLIPEVPE